MTRVGEQIYRAAIPLTPCQGTRIVIQAAIDPLEVMHTLRSFIIQLSEQHGISSWHCLFPDLQQVEQLRSMGLVYARAFSFTGLTRATVTSMISCLP